MLEIIPHRESQQIQHIVALTVQQLQRRYGFSRVLRGVHPKDHGCVTATFEVLRQLPDSVPRAGLFSSPGRVFEQVDVRFSNAATLVQPDSLNGVHGSRGMAIQLHGVDGPVLETDAQSNGKQDFLMVNHPVFAFANVEDYEILSRVLVEHNDDATPFLAQRLPLPPTAPPTTDSERRAQRTAMLIRKIRAAKVVPGDPLSAFQQPPASPVDNEYFGAAPFLCGSEHVMRFKVSPVTRSLEEPDVSDPNYLRTALQARLSPGGSGGPVVFDFKVWVRAAADIAPEVDIEDATRDWQIDGTADPYVTVGRLTIPLQNFETDERKEHCEQLQFTPWHALEAHRPLGGINRLRRAVYRASALFRSLPRFPAQ